MVKSFGSHNLTVLCIGMDHVIKGQLIVIKGQFIKEL